MNTKRVFPLVSVEFSGLDSLVEAADNLKAQIQASSLNLNLLNNFYHLLLIVKRIFNRARSDAAAATPITHTFVGPPLISINVSENLNFRLGQLP